MRWIAFLAAAFLCLILPYGAGADAPCGIDRPCDVQNGSYLARPPAGNGASALPVLLYFHGYKQSGQTVLAMPHLARAAEAAGVLLVAPNGLDGTWSVRGAPRALRDDIAFTASVMADVARRWSIDRERIWVSGFSLGGSMAWNVACYAGDRFAGFLPVSGAFWRPLPESCPAGPVTILHVHGRGDRVVPLEGREIGGRWRQGDVFDGINFWRAHDRCTADPVTSGGAQGLLCREWDRCAGGSRLALCLYDGGHAAPKGWYERALGWIAAPGARLADGGN